MNTDDLFKNQNSFELSIWDEANPDDTTFIKSIHQDSEIIIQLKKWIADNSWNWVETNSTYDMPDALLQGPNFKFIIYESFVVISYRDKNARVRQFFKNADKEYFYYITFKKKVNRNDSSEFMMDYAR
jgi:hypothetical protein